MPRKLSTWILGERVLALNVSTSVPLARAWPNVLNREGIQVFHWIYQEGSGEGVPCFTAGKRHLWFTKGSIKQPGEAFLQESPAQPISVLPVLICLALGLLCPHTGAGLMNELQLFLLGEGNAMLRWPEAGGRVKKTEEEYLDAEVEVQNWPCDVGDRVKFIWTQPSDDCRMCLSVKYGEVWQLHTCSRTQDVVDDEIDNVQVYIEPVGNSWNLHFKDRRGTWVGFPEDVGKLPRRSKASAKYVGLEPVFCELCNVLCNARTQWQEQECGRQHKKNLRKCVQP